MLEKNYAETNSRESEEERVRTALVGVLREYFTFRVIQLFLLQQMDNNPNGFNIHTSLFFDCLISKLQCHYFADFPYSAFYLRCIYFYVINVKNRKL